MLKVDPKYGHFPWWPQDGDDWVHREDVEVARKLIPGPRIFRREGNQGSYGVMTYGSIQLRVKHPLWQEVPWEGLDLGDWVEVLSRGHRNSPRTGTIREMLWDDHDRAIYYQIQEQGLPIENRYQVEDLRPVDPTPHLPTDSD